MKIPKPSALSSIPGPEPAIKKPEVKKKID
jgi:hypothetical protein